MSLLQELLGYIISGKVGFETLDNFVAQFREKATEAVKTEINNIVGTIRSLTDTFVAVAIEKGIPLYYTNEYKVDSDIFNWLPDATITDGEIPKGSITMLPKKGMTEETMLKTALKLPLSQAIIKMTEELTGGYFNEKSKILIIYLTDTKDGVALELVCDRYSDGELRLYVFRVNETGLWDVRDDRVGFLSSNTNGNA